jgi:hypothetical protein
LPLPVATTANVVVVVDHAMAAAAVAVANWPLPPSSLQTMPWLL